MSNDITPKKIETLSLDKFKDMDYQATRDYSLPIELMMENAGYHLARLTVQHLPKNGNKILMGVGNGNNGGGGLVAARRLSAWGYEVAIETFSEINKPLPLAQLERATKFGATLDPFKNYDVYVDAFLGFSQRQPLPNKLIEKLAAANQREAVKISLDIPTGINIDDENAFKPDVILTIAAMKDVRALYSLYGIDQPEFY